MAWRAGCSSNEAGLGSTPHAHALAKVKRPQDQGAVAILGVFIDTFVVLTLTGLVLITSGLVPQGLTGTALTQAAFSQAFGGFGPVFIAVCMFFFAFSTIIGWYFFGQSNFKALFGEKLLPVYSVIVVAFILVGSTLKVDLVWALADLFNGLMAIPNLLALYNEHAFTGGGFLAPWPLCSAAGQVAQRLHRLPQLRGGLSSATEDLRAMADFASRL